MHRLSPLLLTLIFYLFVSVSAVLAAPKEIYNDPETGFEVWRMTNYSNRDMAQYYHHPTISPDGKYLIFRTNRTPYLYIINSDGTGEKPIGSYDTWNRQRGIDFSKNALQGWFSHDSRYYYTYDKLYAIDLNKFQNGETPDQYISQISSTHGNNFFYPMLSPDGRRLFGIANEIDVTSGGSTLKFINTDGTDYREFTPPYYYHSNQAFDVSHGWIGNTVGWYLNNNTADKTKPVVEITFDTQSGGYLGDLLVTVPTGDMWDGSFSHPTISPSGYMLGDGSGFIAGSGRGFLLANTKYWTEGPTERGLKKISDTVPNHSNFSPDAKYLVGNDWNTPRKGFITVYPIVPNISSPIKIARYKPSTSAYESAHPTFSPDGTKIIFFSDILEAGNNDILMAIFKTPSAPSNLQYNDGRLTWQPAPLHREIKEYQIFQSSTQNGNYSMVVTVPSLLTYLEAPSKISAAATTLQVDSTADFPDQGTIEISGLSTELPNEIVTYTGKTATSFTGCIRGVFGSTAAEHYNDSFVWLYTGSHGYQNQLQTDYWYKIKSIEWSGLGSDFSSPVQATVTTPISKPGDANGDGLVNGVDYVVWLTHYGQSVTGPTNGDFNNSGKVDGMDYVMWLTNYGK